MSSLRITAGQTAQLDFAAKNPDGTAKNLTGATLEFVASVQPLAIGKTPTLTNVAGGIGYVKLDPADTAAITKPTSGTYKLWITEAGGDRYPLDEGTLEIRP